MPRKSVGRWTGEPLHGQGGEYLYEHPDGHRISVAPRPDGGDAWIVTLDTGSDTRTIYHDAGREEAFGFAYGWMKRYESSTDHSGFGLGVGL